MPFKANSSYIKTLTESNDKVGRFLESTSRQSQKSAEIYGIGLSRFAKFLELKGKYTLNSVIEALIKQEVNLYILLEDFVDYLTSADAEVPHTKLDGRKLSPRTIQTYVNAVRSYLAYYDIDIIPSKFKRRVKIPRIQRYDEEPIDATDIRNILNSVNSERLKAFLLVLASGGVRAMEAVAIRYKDIDFSTRPTKIHIRPEFSKTRIGRDIYVSDEATKYLNVWIDYRFRDRKRRSRPKYKIKDNDLVFQTVNNKDVSLRYIYHSILRDFNEVLALIDMNERKEGMLRRKITLHSFRRFVKTVLSTQVSQDYSEFYLGHARSTYWQMKEPERSKIYADKCMDYLTFLDYSALESKGKSVESKLEQKDKEIQDLRHEFGELRQGRDEILMNLDNIGKKLKFHKQMNQDVEMINNLLNHKITVTDIPEIKTVRELLESLNKIEQAKAKKKK